jgi:hypothetical protein
MAGEGEIRSVCEWLRKGGVGVGSRKTCDVVEWVEGDVEEEEEELWGEMVGMRRVGLWKKKRFTDLY